jgi:hypothetical protein
MMNYCLLNKTAVDVLRTSIIRCILSDQGILNG